MRLIITILCLSFFSECYGQGYLEVGNLSYDVMPLKIKTTAGDEHFNAGNLKLTDVVPVFLRKDKSQYLLFGLNLESLGFGGVHPEFPVSNIYGVAAVAGYCRQVNDRLNVSAILLPFLNSDLYRVTGSDVHFCGVVRGVYRVHKDFSVRATLGYRKQFYGTQYVVLLGGDWKINNKWRVFGDLPNNATLCYSVRPKINAGISFLSGNTSYHISQEALYLQYNFAQPGVFAEYYLSSMFAVRGTVAYSYLRNLDLYNMDEKVSGVVDYIVLGSKPAALNPEVSNGFAFKLSLSLRISER